MKQKILIVDDVYSNRYLLVQILEEYECLQASNGDEMWKVLRHNVPDLIIMDIGLPGEDGLHLADKVMHDERFRGVPVIFLTAHASKNEIIEGMRSGGYDYLVKPVDDVLLLARVKLALEKSGAVHDNESSAPVDGGNVT